jgi:elongation factor Ts
MSISAKLVKELREKTNLGMMDCKKALTETNGDIDAAVDWLRKKGMAKSNKLAGRIAAEGTVTSYIHMGGKIGVLLELNCETDFTARNDDFVALAREIAMHIAAANPKFVAREEVPEAIIAKEREIAMAQIMAEGKPEHIAEKICEGKLRKYYEENCLLEQKFVKDDKKSVQEMIAEKIQAIGEKITVRRFARYQMGEGLEKRVDNFAEEVAKQTGQA